MDDWVVPGVVVALFTAIHFIEISAYFSRIAGIMERRTASAYTLQAAVSMTTRFFTMALLPAIGFLVDAGMRPSRYLLMCIMAIFGATLAGAAAIALRNRIISAFQVILKEAVTGEGLFRSLLKFPVAFISVKPIDAGMSIDRPGPSSELFFQSAIVFAIYASSVFLVFYGALLFPDHRTALSQLSGVTNAFAAVILTFWIEPMISQRIDETNHADPSNSAQLVMNLVVGRVFGVAIFGGAFLTTLIIWCP